MKQPDVLVVGGGPAGMSAAVAAASRGLAAMIVDEGFDLGGQIYRRPTSPSRAPAPDPRGDELRREVAALAPRIDVRREAVVWGIFDGLRVAVAAGERAEVLQPRTVILATGAYEYVPPFPGWTLPGVMTPGAAQVMVKTAGVVPGKRVLVAGTGPFLLVVASALVRAGVEVVSVLEASPRLLWMLLPLHGWRMPELLRDGWQYLRTLSRAGVPVRYGRMVVAASGRDALESVTHTTVDRAWRPDRSRTEVEQVDTLLVAYGFVPRTSAAQMVGCRMQLRPEAGGWIPTRTACLETSVANVFAAGDGAGVAGSLVAAAEGRLVGLAAARRLGAISDAAFAEARRAPDRQLTRIAPMRRALDRISLLQPGLASLVEDATVVCRCEEVRWSEARDAIRAGCTTYRTLKVATRIGMGPCQGRFCWPAMSRMVAEETRRPLADVGPSSARPPIRPVTMAMLAGTPVDESR